MSPQEPGKKQLLRRNKFTDEVELPFAGPEAKKSPDLFLVFQQVLLNLERK